MTETTEKGDYVHIDKFDRAYANKVMLILAGMVMTVMYVEGMLTPSLPTITQDFNVSASQGSLILAMYMVGGVAATPILGKLGDLYGKKLIMVITLGVYAVAVSVTGFSPNFEFMIVSRTIQGVGMAVMPLGMALVREEFPKELIPRAQAVISAMFGAGFAVSLPLGSLVSNDYGWRWTYHSAIPVVVILLVISLIVIKESRFRKPHVKVDAIGAGILAVSLSLIILALSEGQVWGWVSLNTIAFATVGLAMFIPLILYELRYTRKGGEAILNFRLLSIRNVMVANIALTAAGAGMFLSMFALTYRFAYDFQDSIWVTGISLIPFALGTIIFGPLAGVLVTRTGVKPLSIAGALVTAAGFMLQATLPGYNGVLIFEFVCGAGLSLINATVINLIVLTVNPRDMGLATAMNGTFRSLGSSIGAPVAGSLIATYTTTSLMQGPGGILVPVVIPAGTAFYYSFVIAALVFVATALLMPLSREILGRGRKPRQVYGDRPRADVAAGPE